jgi:hypothetical protein
MKGNTKSNKAAMVFIIYCMIADQYYFFKICKIT